MNEISALEKQSDTTGAQDSLVYTASSKPAMATQYLKPTSKRAEHKHITL